MKKQMIKDFFIEVKRYLGCYTSFRLYKFDQGREFLLQRCLSRGQPVDISYFMITFELDGRYIQVWRRNRWYAYASSIYEVKRVDTTSGKDWLPVTIESLWAPQRSVRRRTLIAFDRMVELYEEARRDERRAIIDAKV